MVENFNNIRIHKLTRKDVQIPVNLELYVNQILKQYPIDEIVIDSSKELCNLRIKNRIFIYANKNFASYYDVSLRELLILFFSH